MDGKLRNMASVYILDGEKILLMYRVGSRVVAPSWCGVGGHFERDELNDAKACVLRELFEESGLTEGDISHLRLRYITLRRKNGEVRQNYYFFAEKKPGVSVPEESDEGALKWFPKSEIEDLEMPCTAKYVLHHYLRAGCGTDAVYAGIATPDGLTMEELKEF
jgi:8-oxo-dGTP diphosphatase